MRAPKLVIIMGMIRSALHHGHVTAFNTPATSRTNNHNHIHRVTSNKLARGLGLLQRNIQSIPCPPSYTYHESDLNMMEIPLQFHAMSITDAYSNALTNHPFITKGTTGLILCGVGDIIAQVRGLDSERTSTSTNEKLDEESLLVTSSSLMENIDGARLLRFSTKGFFGTSIWSAWYDYSESVFNNEFVVSALASAGILDASDLVINIARVFMLMSTEQIFVCPIIYGMWEIPVSTILNGAPISRIPFEIKDKLVDMLVESAKIWTFGNVLIYSSPVQYRSAISNVGDVLWQSIVSDFSADCGNEDEDELVVSMRDYPSVSPPSEINNSVPANRSTLTDSTRSKLSKTR